MTRLTGALVVCLGVVGLAAPRLVTAQSLLPARVGSHTAGQTADAVDAASAPDVQRIRRQLNRPATVVLDSRQLRFYLEIVGVDLRFDEMKNHDFFQSPAKRVGVLSHQEVISAMTPRSAPASATGGVGFDPVVIKHLIAGYVRQRQEQAIRARITKELEAIENNQRTAGASTK